jgi:hypothetical protein
MKTRGTQFDDNKVVRGRGPRPRRDSVRPPQRAPIPGLPAHVPQFSTSRMTSEAGGERGGTRRAHVTSPKERLIMLWTIAVLLAVLWALGLVTSYTMGGFIHILIVLAVVVVVIRVIQGRRIT